MNAVAWTLRGIFCVAIFASMFLSEVFASCMVKPSIEKEAKSSAVVFVGKVLEITPAQLASAGYPVNEKKTAWKKYFYKTDVVTFQVTEVFKGEVSESIEIATSADGDAGYKFDGGTWLKVGQSYLVYASERRLAGTVDTDWTGYDKGVARELKAMQESFPKELAAEINEFNSKVTKLTAGVCGRTHSVEGAEAEIGELRRLFPEAKRFAVRNELHEIHGLQMILNVILQLFT